MSSLLQREAEAHARDRSAREGEECVVYVVWEDTPRDVVHKYGPKREVAYVRLAREEAPRGAKVVYRAQNGACTWREEETS